MRAKQYMRHSVGRLYFKPEQRIVLASESRLLRDMLKRILFKSDHLEVVRFIHESCGYCTPCRVGNVFLRERIQKIMGGYAVKADLDYLKDLSRTIMMTSRCGLGNTSPKPVLSSIEQFPVVYVSLLGEGGEGLQAGFSIQKALEESRRIAKRTSMIYVPVYGGSND